MLRALVFLVALATVAGPVQGAASGADLGVAVVQGPDVVRAQVPFTLFVEIHNHGPDVSPPARFVDALPPGMWAMDQRATNADCAVEGAWFNCTLSSLPPGGRASAALVLRAREEGMWVNVASLASSGDPNPANDVSSLRIPVRPRPSSALACHAAEDGVHLLWTPVEDAAAYTVYRRDPPSDWVHVVSTAATSYRDTGVETGATYVYRATVVDGTLAARSNDCRVVAVPFFPSLVVAGLVAVAGVVAYVALRRGKD